MGSLPVQQQPYRVLIAGGAYGGVSAAVNLLDLSLGRSARLDPDKAPAEKAPDGVPVEIHIVDERDGYYHTIGSPLALSSPDYATKAWRKFDDIAALQHPNVKITQGSLTSIDPDRRVAKINLSSSGETQEDRYDFFIAATGLRRVWPVVPQSLTKEKYLAETADHIECVTTASHGTVVVGGGAVGIEMAAEAKLCHPHTSVKLVHSRSKLLSSEPLPDEVKDLALHALRDAGVEVFLSERVTGTTASIGPDGRPMQTLTLQDGSHLVASQVITAISRSVPATSYLPESALDSEGLVKIDSHLNFLPSHPYNAHHLAIGDLVSWAGIKRCGAAIAMGTRAADNIFQQILSEQYGIPTTLKDWPKYPPMIGLAVGKKAVVYDPEGGAKCSEEAMKIYFGNDLAFQQCWDYQKLDEGW